jgi:hypothetical protein
MRAFALLLAVVCITSALPGQSLAGRNVGLSQLGRSHDPPNRSTTVLVDAPRTYWLEGTIVGAVVGLVGGLQLQHGICTSVDCSGTDHFVFAVPMLLLAIIGGLIGTGIHKS